MTETVLSTLAGGSEHERLQVAWCHDALRGSRIELRQQSWGEGVGWFTQSKIELLPHQLGELRASLGGSVRKVPAAPRPSRNVLPGFVPRVVHAESA